MNKIYAMLASLLLIGGTVGIVAAANATDDDHKEVICHPNGSPAGYSKVNVDKHSSHFKNDGTPKHEHDGRVDVYSTNGLCPGEVAPTEPTEDPTDNPTDDPTDTPTTDIPTEDPTPVTDVYKSRSEDYVCGNDFKTVTVLYTYVTYIPVTDRPITKTTYKTEKFKRPVKPSERCDEPKGTSSVKCVGNALVTKTTDAKGNISSSTVNGAKACRPNTTGTPTQRSFNGPVAPTVEVVEEGM